MVRATKKPVPEVPEVQETLVINNPVNVIINNPDSLTVNSKVESESCCSEEKACCNKEASSNSEKHNHHSDNSTGLKILVGFLIFLFGIMIGAATAPGPYDFHQEYRGGYGYYNLNQMNGSGFGGAVSQGSQGMFPQDGQGTVVQIAPSNP